MQRAGQSELTGEAPEPSPASEDDSPSLDGLSRDDRRRLRGAWWCGAGPLLVLYLWILTVGAADLFRSHVLDDVFDTQARSFLDGRLAVPAELVGVAGVPVEGETHVHHGPVPALLRIPVLLVTDRLDGRLATLSMLAAAAVFAAVSFRLLCALRPMVRGRSPVRRTELVATAGLAVATVGSPPLFLASSTTVHHEALMWGIALAVAAFDAIARYQLQPTGRRLALATLLITATLLTRQSVGLGPLVALGLTGVARVLPSLRQAVRVPAGPTLGRSATDRARARTARDWARTAGEWTRTAGDWVRTAGDWVRTAGEWVRTAGEWARTAWEWVGRARAWVRSVRPREGHILPERQLPVPSFDDGGTEEDENGEAQAGRDDPGGARHHREVRPSGDPEPGTDAGQNGGNDQQNGGNDQDGAQQDGSGDQDGARHEGEARPSGDAPPNGAPPNARNDAAPNGARPERHARGSGGDQPDGEPAPVHRRLARTLGVVALAGALPLVLSVGLDLARFGTVIGTPSGEELTSPAIAAHREILRTPGDRPHGLRFAPTTLQEYLRPDGLDLRRDFPWIDFPPTRPWLVGDTAFEELDWTGSLPATAPALTALAGVAVVWAVRTRHRRRSGPWFSPLWLGALAGAAGVVTFGYVANRYLTDLVPVVLLPALAGYHVALRVAPGWEPRRRRVVTAALIGLVALGALANTALALSYQRERGPVAPESWRAEWVSWRAALPGAHPPVVVDGQRPSLPDAAVEGRLAIVDGCQGMYARVGREWQGVERGPGVGVHDLEVDLDALTDGERVPLITLGGENDMAIVAIRRLDDEWVRVDVSRPPGTGGGWRLGVPTRLAGTVTLRVDADPREPPDLVTHGRQVLLAAPLPTSPTEPMVGRAPEGHGVATRYPDDAVTPVPLEPEVCRSVHPGGDEQAVGGPTGGGQPAG